MFTGLPQAPARFRRVCLFIDHTTRLIRLFDERVCDELKVLAPATAIFYSAPSPSEPEYVNVGDTIDIESTLCQLEAMKIFTPMKLADFNGDVALYEGSSGYVVTRVNMSNGQQVNTGDLLFVVKPASSAS